MKQKTPVPEAESILTAEPKKRMDVSKFIIFLIWLALIAVLASTGLGVLKIGALGVTTLHIPVIVGAIVLGVGYGSLLGVAFGFASMLVATYVPFEAAFVFSPFIGAVQNQPGNIAALLVAFVPRIALGAITALVFKLFKMIMKKSYFSYAIAAFVGSISHSLLVVLFIRLFFSAEYAVVAGVADTMLTSNLLLTVVVQGLPEAAAAILIALGIGRIALSREKREEVIAAKAAIALAERNMDLLKKNEELNSDNERLREKTTDIPAEAPTTTEPIPETPIESEPEAETTEPLEPEQPDNSADSVIDAEVLEGETTVTVTVKEPKKGLFGKRKHNKE